MLTVLKENLNNMQFELCVLASGSSGNAIYVATENTRLLIDAGLSAKQIEQRPRKHRGHDVQSQCHLPLPRALRSYQRRTRSTKAPSRSQFMLTNPPPRVSNESPKEMK